MIARSGDRTARIRLWRSVPAARAVVRQSRQAKQRHEGVVGTTPCVMPGEQPYEPVQVAVERRVQVHLHAQILDHRDALRTCDPLGGTTQQGFFHAADVGVLGHRNRLQYRLDVGIARRVFVEPCPRHEPVLHDDRSQRREAPGIRARAHGEVEVRHGSRLAAPRIDDDQRTRRIVLDRLQQRPRAREAVRLPRILSDEHGHFAMLEVAVYAAAHHLPLHPGFPGLFLCERIGAVLHAERLQRAVGVGRSEVIALAAAAVVENAIAAVLVADALQPRGNLTNGSVPLDALIAAVRAPAHRRVNAIGAVLVVVHALRLLAQIALGNRVCSVAADAHDALRAGLDFEAAVHRAEYAGRLLPMPAFRLHSLIAPSRLALWIA